MSLAILEQVKEFLIRLVKDEAFRTQLMSDKIEEVKKTFEDSGYAFSQEEFETAAIKILELKELGEFDDLSEEELLGAVGGLTVADVTTDRLIRPPYWYPWYPWPPKVSPLPLPQPIPNPKPLPTPQPLYGIVINPYPPVQALYGVVVPNDVE